jgi:hypothetical protein
MEITGQVSDEVTIEIDADEVLSEALSSDEISIATLVREVMNNGDFEELIEEVVSDISDDEDLDNLLTEVGVEKIKEWLTNEERLKADLKKEEEKRAEEARLELAAKRSKAAMKAAKTRKAKSSKRK